MTELTKSQRLVFFGKSRLLIVRRGIVNLFRGPKKLHKAAKSGSACFAKSQTPLWSGRQEEKAMELGKVENLRRAAASVNGLLLPAGAVFSFWSQIGPPWRMRGYVKGRELRMGCIIPKVGGGLCQLSNTLYGCALDAGFPIVERHPHSAVISFSNVPEGRDATVFWNYIDLRFKVIKQCVLKVWLTDEKLCVELWEPA
jgi:vancomycin resistance protein VanW